MVQNGQDKYRLAVLSGHKKYAVREIRQDGPPHNPPDDRKLLGRCHNPVECSANGLQKSDLNIWCFHKIPVGCFLQIQLCFGLNDECGFHDG